MIGQWRKTYRGSFQSGGRQWLDLTGKRVIIVGNGPSAPQYGAVIDKYDVVVRVQGFPLDGRTGNKWDIWFCSFSGPAKRLHRKYGLYQKTMPSYIITHDPNRMNNTPVTKIPNLKVWAYTDYTRLVLHLHHLGGKRLTPPSSGFRAIDAILQCNPAELTIVGFDADYIGNRATWKHWWGPAGKESSWVPESSPTPHRFDLEKKALTLWLQTRSFCGRNYANTIPVWVKYQREPGDSEANQHTERDSIYSRELLELKPPPVRRPVSIPQMPRYQPNLEDVQGKLSTNAQSGRACNGKRSSSYFEMRIALLRRAKMHGGKPGT